MHSGDPPAPLFFRWNAYEAVMSDSDSTDIDDIREQKREQLQSAATSPDEPVHVEDQAHFQELLEDNALVLVDFFATWCGPCDMIAPIVEEVAAESDAAVAKVDIDELQGLAAEYNVRSVPTLLLFARGEQAEQLVGVQEKDRLLELIERHGSN